MIDITCTSCLALGEHMLHVMSPPGRKLLGRTVEISLIVLIEQCRLPDIVRVLSLGTGGNNKWCQRAG